MILFILFGVLFVLQLVGVRLNTKLTIAITVLVLLSIVFMEVISHV